jgi:hypothetical protein
MNNQSGPRRILQIYDRAKQAQFKNMTALLRLEWLEAINKLYWAGMIARQKKKKVTG